MNQDKTPCRLGSCCPILTSLPNGEFKIEDDYGGAVRLNFLQLRRLYQEAQTQERTKC